MALFGKSERDLELEDLKRAMLRKFPSLGTTASGLKMKFQKGAGTAYTDHESVYFDPEFMDSLPYDDKVFVMSHEVMHVAFNHIPRLRGKDGQMRDLATWNIATDAVINQILQSEGFKIPEGMVNQPEAIDKSAEDMYTKLYEDKKKRQEQRDQQGKNGQKGKGGEGESKNQQQQGGKGKQQQQQQNQEGEGEGGQGNGKGKQQDQQQQSGQGQGNSQQQQQNQQGQGGNQQNQQQQNDQNGQGGQQQQQGDQQNQGGQSQQQQGGQNQQNGQQSQGGGQGGQQQQNQNGQNGQQNGQNQQQNGGGQSGDENNQNGQNQDQQNGQGGEGDDLQEPQQPTNHQSWEDALKKYEKKKQKQKNKDKDKDKDKGDEDESEDGDESEEDKFRKDQEKQHEGQDKKDEFEEDKDANSQNKNGRGRNQGEEGDEQDDSDYEEFEKEFKELNRELKKKMADEIRRKIDKRVREGGLGEGGLPGEFGAVGEAKAAVSWKKLLKKEFEKVDMGWSYRRANRDNFYSARIERIENYDQPATEVILDTSGSISDALLRGFLRQVKALLKDAYSQDGTGRDIKLKVGCFDDRFHGFTEIKKADDIDKYRFRGGGGTCIDSACRAFTKDKKINRIVFTDGYDGAGFPNGDYKNLNIIFVVFDNPNFQYADGKVIHVKSREIINQSAIVEGRKTSAENSVVRTRPQNTGNQSTPHNAGGHGAGNNSSNGYDDEYDDDYEM